MAAAVIQGLKRFMSFSRSDTEHGKMQHSFSSPSRFEAHKEETDSDDSSTTSDNPGSTLKSTTSPPLSIYEPMSPNSTLRASMLLRVFISLKHKLIRYVRTRNMRSDRPCLSLCGIQCRPLQHPAYFHLWLSMHGCFSARCVR